jgi:hypothetical protein
MALSPVSHSQKKQGKQIGGGGGQRLTDCSGNTHRGNIKALITCALVLPVNVLELESLVALAYVAAEGVDALPEPGAHRLARRALVHI